MRAACNVEGFVTTRCRLSGTSTAGPRTTLAPVP